MIPYDYDSINSDFDDMENAYDANTGTEASLEFADTDGSQYLIFWMPTPDMGEATAIELNVNARVTIDSWSGTGEMDIVEAVYGGGDNVIVTRSGIIDDAGTTENTSYTRNLASPYGTANNILPDTVQLRAYGAADPGDDVDGSAGVREVYLDVTYDMQPTTENYWDVVRALNGIDFVYCGNDGLAQSYTGGSGAATEIHEIHRDLMARFAGFDFATLDNWSDLGTEHSAWYARYWVLEPTPLRDILEKIQYEGCFIFIPREDGGKYIWVKDSYSSGDVLHTFTENDYEDLSISLTNVKEIVTKTTYNYSKHPALGTYIDSTTFTGTAVRTAYQIGASENHETINLDALVAYVNYGSDPNDSLATYYNAINGACKKMVDLKLINPAYFDVEVGDIIQVNDSDVDCFGATWTDNYFMVVKTKRRPNSITLTLRKVYES